MRLGIYQPIHPGKTNDKAGPGDSIRRIGRWFFNILSNYKEWFKHSFQLQRTFSYAFQFQKNKLVLVSNYKPPPNLGLLDQPKPKQTPKGKPTQPTNALCTKGLSNIKFNTADDHLWPFRRWIGKYPFHHRSKWSH